MFHESPSALINAQALEESQRVVSSRMPVSATQCVKAEMGDLELFASTSLAWVFKTAFPNIRSTDYRFFKVFICSETVPAQNSMCKIKVE